MSFLNSIFLWWISQYPTMYGYIFLPQKLRKPMKFKILKPQTKMWILVNSHDDKISKKNSEFYKF